MSVMSIIQYDNTCNPITRYRVRVRIFHQVHVQLQFAIALKKYYLSVFPNRRIKHDFPFINICRVPREVLKTEGETRFSTFPRDLANVNE